MATTSERKKEIEKERKELEEKKEKLDAEKKELEEKEIKEYSQYKFLDDILLGLENDIEYFSFVLNELKKNINFLDVNNEFKSKRKSFNCLVEHLYKSFQENVHDSISLFTEKKFMVLLKIQIVQGSLTRIYSRINKKNASDTTSDLNNITSDLNNKVENAKVEIKGMNIGVISIFGVFVTIFILFFNNINFFIGISALFQDKKWNYIALISCVNGLMIFGIMVIFDLIKYSMKIGNEWHWIKSFLKYLFPTVLIGISIFLFVKFN